MWLRLAKSASDRLVWLSLHPAKTTRLASLLADNIRHVTVLAIGLANTWYNWYAKFGFYSILHSLVLYVALSQNSWFPTCCWSYTEFVLANHLNNSENVPRVAESITTDYSSHFRVTTTAVSYSDFTANSYDHFLSKASLLFQTN